MVELPSLALLGTVVSVIFIALVAMLIIIKAFYVKVEQGTALIVNNLKAEPKVSFTGSMVLPVIHKKELMRVSLITLDVDRRGKDGLICADNMRADITVAFYLRVNETAKDVLKVAKAIGATRASNKDAVNELFNAKFSEALKTVGKQIEFVQLFENRLAFREKIIQVIGEDLNGYVLEDVAIDYLEQTPISSLDPNNILDAEGIKKITELTASQNVVTNQLERDKELAMTKKNVETKEALLELEKQEKEAQARQAREVASIQAREEAETKKIQEEERQKAEQTTIAVEQELLVQKENQQREVKVAEQNKLRALAIEEEKVLRARELEAVSRMRDVELQRIESERAVELEKKEIANVIRERIVVDKTVAIEEERIKEVREVSEAEREKQKQLLAAEAKAEEIKIQKIKAAEAEESAAKYEAMQIETIAQAKLEASTKESEAKKRMAEGMQAEQAAAGLAQVKVEEAKADAIEKAGVAESKVILAKAEALEKQGLVEASVIAAKGEAAAKNSQDQGVADAHVIREKFKAEADGLTEKIEAMNKMSDQARQHEEFRMSLETALKEAMASIAAGENIAKENAEVLATALQKAKIDIVGGEDHFFNNFAKSLSIGKAIDGFAGKSDVIQSLVGKFLAPQVPSEKV